MTLIFDWNKHNMN